MSAYDEMMDSINRFASAYRWSKESYQPVFIERLKKRTGLTEYELITNLMLIISKQNQEFSKIADQLRESEQKRVINDLAHCSEVEKLRVEIRKMRTISTILNLERG